LPEPGRTVRSGFSREDRLRLRKTEERAREMIANSVARVAALSGGRRNLPGRMPPPAVPGGHAGVRPAWCGGADRRPVEEVDLLEGRLEEDGRG